MATKRMLIDASHPEETRVVVVDGNKVEDYDVEVANRRQLKGNIYLAKVTRVEPSLQAAFVDYGGNRHGFLAFNEIHPDYYQIPVADRERLLAEQAAESAEREESAEDGDGAEAGGADDDDDLERRRARHYSRFYKIQEVIKRRQIMLVQVSKEERGNKGAALTSFLSLAGRYCVLMPNTARGGGISRKISSVIDRKRLKKILSELDVPEGMAVIVRTAGAGRSKAEIKRDYEYLVRLWSSIRETTLQSTAPTLVYEEASLIKRSIRDLYGRDIEEIIVQGEEEYRIAKEFMKLFISSHAKRVKLYEDSEKPLFQEYQVEDHLDAMHQPTVQLRSGGYIVINPTEALVAIDVNSGRSTRERNIEETATRTNLEAADEIGRQLRLRDLAGLIVIDFIDMENARNQGMVERRLKEAMKNDRARVQIGRISPFGLLELSRQRLRPSLIETSFEVCPACGGNGLRRTTESTALALLRKLEEEGIRRRTAQLSIATPPSVALYLLNQKRRALLTIESRYSMSVAVIEDPTLVPPDHRIDRLRPIEAGVRDEREEREERQERQERHAVAIDEEDEEEAESEETDEETAEAAAEAAERDDGARRGRRRRPRRRRRGDEDAPREASREGAGDGAGEGSPGFAGEFSVQAAEGEDDGEAGLEPADEAATGEPGAAVGEAGEQPARKRRRRGRRGGRRRMRSTDQPGEGENAAEAAAFAASRGGDADAFGDDGDEAEGDEAATFAGDGDRHVVGEEGDLLEAADGGEPDDGADQPVEASDAPDIEAPEAPPRPRRRVRRPRKSSETKIVIAMAQDLIEDGVEAEVAGEVRSGVTEEATSADADDAVFADESPSGTPGDSEEQPWPLAADADDDEMEMAPDEAPEVVGEARPSLVDDDEEPEKEESDDNAHERFNVAAPPEAAEPAEGQEQAWRDDDTTEPHESEAREREDEVAAQAETVAGEDKRDHADLPEPGEAGDDDTQRHRFGSDEAVVEDADREAAVADVATDANEQGPGHDAGRAPEEAHEDERDAASAETHVEHIGERGGEPDVERSGESGREGGDERDGERRDDRHLVSAGSRAPWEHGEPAQPDQPARVSTSEVIRVGEDDDRDSEEARRRGWWQRFLS